MRIRVLKAAAALAAIVPTLALAQQRPAQRPAQQPQRQPQRAAQRPAAMEGPRTGAILVSVQPSIFIARDKALSNHLQRLAALADDPSDYLPGAAGSIAYQVTPSIAVGAGVGFGVTSGVTLIQPGVGASYTFSPGNRMTPYIIGAVQASRYSGDRAKATGIGGGGTLGIRYMLNANTALLVNGRVAYENYSDENINAIVGRFGVGLGWAFGGGPPRDTDGDGVPDRRDRCANTPRGATVDARGCPSDTDRDGVLNGLDQCPDTPANTPVDARGCTRDSDGDGIADNADRCPNTPRGVPVDASGCPRDADGDGVHDGADRCPNTPAGTPVDANGCPRDSDGDGVHDGADRCADTPAGTPVDETGCPRDSDGDGVHDGADRCPNTARGTQVNAEGCPVQRDSDGDGVVDERDRCPNTAAGRRVDSTGCIIEEALTRVGEALRLQNILFRGGSSTLDARSNNALNDIARQLRGVLETAPGARFEIGGHTDNRGGLAVNRRLSQARAQAVLRYLVSQGVPEAALTAVGYGPEQSVASNTTAAGRAQNRRVEIKRLN